MNERTSGQGDSTCDRPSSSCVWSRIAEVLSLQFQTSVLYKPSLTAKRSPCNLVGFNCDSIENTDRNRYAPSVSKDSISR